jgi:hypothetical protein
LKRRKLDGPTPFNPVHIMGITNPFGRRTAGCHLIFQVIYMCKRADGSFFFIALLKMPFKWEEGEKMILPHGN